MATSLGRLPLGPITSVGLWSRCVSHQVSTADGFPTVSPLINDFGGVFRQHIASPPARGEARATSDPSEFSLHWSPSDTDTTPDSPLDAQPLYLLVRRRTPTPALLRGPNRVKGERAHPFHDRLSHTCSNSGLGEGTRNMP